MAVEEILVHVSGPCTRTDDEQYRKLALNYSKFDLDITHSLLNSAQSHDASGTQTETQYNGVSQGNVNDEDLSLAKVHGPSDDVVIPMTTTTDRTTFVDAASFSGIGYIEDTPAATQALESQLLTSSLDPWPGSQPQLEHQSTAKLLPFEYSSPQYPATSSQDVGIAVTGSKIPVAGETSQCNSHPGKSSESSDSQDREHCGQEENRSNEIHAPDPIASDDKAPPSLVTLPLQGLVDKQLKGWFKPTKKHRDIKSLERGYWSIDISAWDALLFDKCWRYLEKFVGSGRAGWSVSCYRSKDPPNDSVSSANESTTSKAGHCYKSIRVHCWGQIVEHIYLLIYVASMSKVKHCPSVWIDAADRVVLEMP